MNSGKQGKVFEYTDILAVFDDFSDGGKAIDFSGERQYPFPFGVNMTKRKLYMAAKTREDRVNWLSALKLFYVVKKLHENGSLFKPEENKNPYPGLEKRSRSQAVSRTQGNMHINRALNEFSEITNEIIKGFSPRDRPVPIQAA